MAKECFGRFCQMWDSGLDCCSLACENPLLWDELFKTYCPIEDEED